MQNEYIRNMRVNELNRLLPMVRNTIKKEREYASLAQKLDEQEEKLKKVGDILDSIEFLLKNDLIEKSDKEYISLVKGNLESVKEKLSHEVDELCVKVDNLEDELDFETGLYKRCTVALAVSGGFLFSNEIKKDFIQEYIYLLLMPSDFANRLTMKKLFMPEANMIFKVLVQNEILTVLEEGDSDSRRHLFDKLFR